MGHHDDGFAQFTVKPFEQCKDLGRRHTVEVAGRFVSHDQQRVGDDGARNGDALLLSAGQFRRIVRGTLGQANHLQGKLDPLAPFAAAQIRQQQRQFDVLEGAEHRHQIVELKNKPDVCRTPVGQLGFRQSGHFLPANAQLATVGFVDSGNQIEQRAFT